MKLGLQSVTLCEKEQLKDMNENKINMFFDSKNN